MVNFVSMDIVLPRDHAKCVPDKGGAFGSFTTCARKKDFLVRKELPTEEGIAIHPPIGDIGRNFQKLESPSDNFFAVKSVAITVSLPTWCPAYRSKVRFG
jgi:hypothetical protein